MANCGINNDEIEILLLLAEASTDSAEDTLDSIKQVAQLLAEDGETDIHKTLTDNPRVMKILASNMAILQDFSTYIDKLTEQMADGLLGTEEDVQVSSKAIRATINVLTEFQQEHIESFSTNTESEDIYNRDYRNTVLVNLPSPTEDVNVDAHLQNFLTYSDW